MVEVYDFVVAREVWDLLPPDEGVAACAVYERYCGAVAVDFIVKLCVFMLYFSHFSSLISWKVSDFSE